MQKFQTSRRGGIQDFLCPFTDMYITQGSNGQFSHKGTMANDVRGAQAGVRYDYFAPCDVKCVWVYPQSGQSMWKSLEKVRFANGNIDYATFMIAHDNIFNIWVGKVVNQGDYLGTMGDKGNATGVHCHIEIAQHDYDLSNWNKNSYGIYCFPNETDTDDCYFVDNTNILYGMGGSWKHTTDVPVNDKKYINIPEWIEERRVYDINTRVQVGLLKPKKFGGLSYYVYNFIDEYAEIETRDFGHCLVKVTESTPITDVPTYEYGNY